MAGLKKLRQREEIDDRYKWNIAAMYGDEKEWEKDFKESEKMAEEFSAYSGRLSGGAEVLLSALRDRDKLWMKAEKVYVYSQMKKDEDNRRSRYQELNQRAQSLLAQISSATAFFTPELTELPEGTIEKYLEETGGTQRIFLYAAGSDPQKTACAVEGIRSSDGADERNRGRAETDFLHDQQRRYQFRRIHDEDGDEIEVTHGNYISLMESSDRAVRKAAYENLYAAYAAQKNTLAATYNYNAKKNCIISKIRNYPSALAAELDGDNIPEAVYRNLVKSVNENLDVLHRYVGLRKKLLGVDEIRMYDMYAPLMDMPKRDVPYEEALEIVRKGLRPMGEDYLKVMNDGIETGWIDVFENEGKTSGAYSFGSYDSMPYVLLNYNNKFKDAFTIVHETGTFDELLLYERKTAVYLRRTFYLHRRSGVHRQRVSADARPFEGL